MRILPAALTLSAAILGPAAAGARDVALIVHPRNPVSDVSWAEVAAMLKGEQQHWKGGRKIYLILLEAGTAERAIVLDRVYRMTDLQLKQYWLAKLYRGDISAFPRAAASSGTARRIVAQAPNALAFVDAAAADATVKVLRIDGLAPGDPGYRLAAVP